MASTKKAVLKTAATEGSVEEFLASLTDERRRDECNVLLEIMGRVAGAPPVMWGPSIIGFGQRVLTYESGRTLDWFTIGFSPRKAALTVYILDGFPKYEELLSTLGPHTTGKSCLYLKHLSAVDLSVLEEICRRSIRSLT
jgi:hypothetical protein